MSIQYVAKGKERKGGVLYCRCIVFEPMLYLHGSKARGHILIHIS